MFPAVVLRAWRTLAALLRAESVPEAKIVRSPVSERDGPPATGASTSCNPFLSESSWVWIDTAEEGAIVEEMTMTASEGNTICQLTASSMQAYLMRYHWCQRELPLLARQCWES